MENSSYEIDDNVDKLCREEDNIFKRAEKLQQKIIHLGNDLNELLCSIKNDLDAKIAIYGVPAKATTLMYALGINEKMIEFAVDDAPLKQGTFTPGKHIPVFSAQTIYEKNPDYLLILAWNFADPIMKNTKISKEHGLFHCQI